MTLKFSPKKRRSSNWYLLYASLFSNSLTPSGSRRKNYSTWRKHTCGPWRWCSDVAPAVDATRARVNVSDSGSAGPSPPLLPWSPVPQAMSLPLSHCSPWEPPPSTAGPGGCRTRWSGVMATEKTLMPRCLASFTASSRPPQGSL